MSIAISLCAFLVSCISITLSLLNYRKDRWKLAVTAWIYVPRSSEPSLPDPPNGRLGLKASNVGRRQLTLGEIFVQVFSDEIEELRNQPLVQTFTKGGLGCFASFAAKYPSKFPLQLKESEPITVDVILVGIEKEKLESRERLCLLSITGRKKLVKFPCILPGGAK